jgi:hypothetical protein
VTNAVCVVKEFTVQCLCGVRRDAQRIARWLLVSCVILLARCRLLLLKLLLPLLLLLLFLLLQLACRSRHGPSLLKCAWANPPAPQHASNVTNRKTVPQTFLHLCTLPMGNSDWSKACSAQAARTPLQLQQANYGGCIFAVSEAFPAALCCVAARARGHLLWV